MGIQINNKQVLDMNYLGKKAYSAVLNGDYVFASTLKKVSGIQNNIKDAASLPINKLYLEGNSYQETTSGKNLFDSSMCENVNRNGLTTTLNSDGSVTIKGTPTGNYQSLNTAGKKTDITDLLVEGEKYTISQNIGGYIYLQVDAKALSTEYTTQYITASNSPSVKSKTFTVDKSKYTYEIGLQTGIATSVGENVNITLYLQLEKGSTATEYEPYTNGASPNPDYPQDIEVIEGSVGVDVVGKNLFDKNDTSKMLVNHYFYAKDTIKTGSGLKMAYIPCKPNTTYTVSKIVSARFIIGYTNEVPAHGVLVIGGTQNNTEKALTTTTSSDAKYLCVFYKHSSDTLTAEEIEDTIQIEENYKATEYESYKKLTHTGKNICPTDISDWELGQYSTAGNTGIYENRIRVNALIPCKPNTTYYFNTFTATIYYVIGTFKQDKSYNTSVGIVYPTHSITTDANTYYLGVTIYDSVNTTDDLLAKIENGTIKPFICLNSETDKTYEPYGKPSIDLQDNFLAKTSDICDELDIVSGKLIKRIGKVVLNGTEFWESVGSMNTDDIHCYAYTNVFDKLFSTNGSDFKKSMCNRLPYINGLWAGVTISNEVFSTTSGQSRLRLAIKKSRLSSITKTGLADYLSENPITVYYILAEPYEVQLDTTKIPLFEGINNVKIVTNLEPSLTELDYYLR